MSPNKLSDYAIFFETATNSPPMPYQSRLATQERFPRLLEVPTGLGKTAAIVLAWLYRLHAHPSSQVRSSTPRRLVYCLPMRVLVDQTHASIARWLERLAEAKAFEESGVPSLHLMMGGTLDERWEGQPEQASILVGTQDQLLSRALNRGYAMSRYRWPMHFALVNNDALWVCDEVQLMGSGLHTTVQLDGLRNRWGTYGPSGTVWMSATLDPKTLELPDATPLVEADRFRLDEQDLAHPVARQRLHSRKTLSRASVALSDETTKVYPRQVAELVLESHRPNTLTLVVVNRVSRAQEIYSELRKRLAKNPKAPTLGLVHARMRPADRLRQEAILTSPEAEADRIVVATQAVEAGVDVSSNTLFTELAPFSSLVQRFGRLNRYGEQNQARAFWIDLSEGSFATPYNASDLARAREHLSRLSEAGPEALSSVHEPPPSEDVHVLRAKDLLDLFDTSPDLTGQDLDVSRYIRDSDGRDVQVFWRNFEGRPPEGEEWTPGREELCTVAIEQVEQFLKQATAWFWDPLLGNWREVKTLRPGMTLLLSTQAGGYDPELGWTGKPEHRPTEVSQAPAAIPFSGDPDTFLNQWVLLRDHSVEARDEAKALRATLDERYPDLPWDSVVTATWRHDHGKGHEAFQNMLFSENASAIGKGPWAKSGVRSRAVYWVSDGENRQERRGFRHELASALAWIEQAPDHPERDLIAYLMAAHHGKIRLSLRSHPDEVRPPEEDRLFCRGVWDGDVLPEVDLGDGLRAPACRLRLDVMQLGWGEMGPSWLERALNLRDRFGPFRLAYLETLVRVADWRASQKERV